MNHLDPSRLSAKKARAARISGENFLHERALQECIERLNDLFDPVERVLIVDTPSLEHTPAGIRNVGAVNRRPLKSLEPECADVVIAVGILEETDDPATAAFVLRHALRPGGRLIGAAIGSGSLAKMRRAFLDAERAAGQAARRFHLLPDANSLSALLASGGLSDVVIDVDAFNVRYDGLDGLVRDLRSMGCTSSLAGTVPPISRNVYAKARDLFSVGAERADESFEILHFSGVAKIKV